MASRFVDCTTLHNCSSCLSEWSCVWCVRHNATWSSRTNASTALVAGHCAPGQFWGAENSTVEQCPSYEYRVCGLDGRITAAAAAVVALVFLAVLVALCWCCWCRRRRGKSAATHDQHAITAAQRRARFSTLSPGALQNAPSSAEMRRKLLVDVSDDDDSDLAFHSTPTPIADQRRKEMTLKWGIASDSSSHQHQATYSSAPSRTPPSDAVYFSSIN